MISTDPLVVRRVVRPDIVHGGTACREAGGR